MVPVVSKRTRFAAAFVQLPSALVAIGRTGPTVVSNEKRAPRRLLYGQKYPADVAPDVSGSTIVPARVHRRPDEDVLASSVPMLTHAPAAFRPSSVAVRKLMAPR